MGSHFGATKNVGASAKSGGVFSLDDLLASKSSSKNKPTSNAGQSTSGQSSLYTRASNLGRARPITAASPGATAKTSSGKKQQFVEPKSTKPTTAATASKSKTNYSLLNELLGTKKLQPKQSMVVKQSAQRPQSACSPTKSSSVTRQSASRSSVKSSTAKTSSMAVRKSPRGGKSLILVGKRRKASTSPAKSTKKVSTPQSTQRSTQRTTASTSKNKQLQRKRDTKALEKKSLALRKAKLKESIRLATTKNKAGSGKSTSLKTAAQSNKAQNKAKRTTSRSLVKSTNSSKLRSSSSTSRARLLTSSSKHKIIKKAGGNTARQLRSKSINKRMTTSASKTSLRVSQKSGAQKTKTGSKKVAPKKTQQKLSRRDIIKALTSTRGRNSSKSARSRSSSPTKALTSTKKQTTASKTGAKKVPDKVASRVFPAKKHQAPIKSKAQPSKSGSNKLKPQKRTTASAARRQQDVSRQRGRQQKEEESYDSEDESSYYSESGSEPEIQDGMNEFIEDEESLNESDNLSSRVVADEAPRKRSPKAQNKKGKKKQCSAEKQRKQDKHHRPKDNKMQQESFSSDENSAEEDLAKYIRDKQEQKEQAHQPSQSRVSPRKTASPEAARQRMQEQAASQTDSEREDEYSDDYEGQHEMTYQPRNLNFQTMPIDQPSDDEDMMLAANGRKDGAQYLLQDDDDGYDGDHVDRTVDLIHTRNHRNNRNGADDDAEMRSQEEQTYSEQSSDGAEGGQLQEIPSATQLRNMARVRQAQARRLDDLEEESDGGLQQDQEAPIEHQNDVIQSNNVPPSFQKDKQVEQDILFGDNSRQNPPLQVAEIPPLQAQEPIATEEIQQTASHQQRQAPPALDKSIEPFGESDSDEEEHFYLSQAVLETVPKRQNEPKVTGFCRYMVKEYIKAKDRVRYYSPQIAKRGNTAVLNQYDNKLALLQLNELYKIKKSGQLPSTKPHEKIVLIKEKDQKISRWNGDYHIECQPLPKLRSAYNAPYVKEEHSQLQAFCDAQRLQEPSQEELQQNAVQQHNTTSQIQQLAAEKQMEKQNVPEHHRIMNLPLPEHLQNLLALFEQFERELLHYRSKQQDSCWTTSLERMELMINQTGNRNFTESHFRQFLTIVPSFYLHKWELISGSGNNKLCLMIELPEDAPKQIFDDNLAQQSRESMRPLVGNLSDEVAKWRLDFFRNQLYNMTYRQFIKARDEIKNLSPDLYADLGMDSDNNGEDDDQSKQMTHWPEFFDVNSIPHVRKSDLKPRPKLNNFQSMQSILQEYNIRPDHQLLVDRKRSADTQSQQGVVNVVGEQVVQLVGARSAAGSNNANDHYHEFNNDQSSNGMLPSAMASSSIDQQDRLCAAEPENDMPMKGAADQQQQQQHQFTPEDKATQEKREQLQEHIRVAEALRQLFVDKGVRQLYLSEVLDQLQNRSMYHSRVDFCEMKKVIGSISRILPTWVRICAMPKGPLVRMDGRMQFQIGTIKQIIQKHFERLMVQQQSN